MKWFKILLVWCCIIPIAILNGGFREYVLDKYFPTEWGLAFSGILLSVLIFLIVRLCLPCIKSVSEKDGCRTGVLWAVLTICFELGFGWTAGVTWTELLEAYNPMTGNLWILVVLSTLFSPIWVCRKIIRKERIGSHYKDDFS